ncbi:MAG: phosphotransferase [Caldilineaceae bacterium]
MARSDESTYVARIGEVYPDLAIRSTRLHNFAEGQFNAILFVNETAETETLVFRFPRVEAALKDLPDEIYLLTGLQGYTTLPVPNPTFVSPELRVMGKAFMGYSMLPGTPLWEESVHAMTDEVKLDHLAWQLALFLKELHNLDTEAIGLHIPVDDPQQSWLDMYQAFQTHLFPHMRRDTCAWVTQNFDIFFNDATNFSYQPVLCHTDFGGSNILFDKATCTVTGVIDWAGATLSDPAIDVAAILNMGEGFFARMVNTYPAMADMVSRTHFFRSTYILQEALNALHDGDTTLFASAIAHYQ